jgi:hypothetical protein
VKEGGKDGYAAQRALRSTKRKRCKCYVPPIPKAYGRGSDEDDASESCSRDELEEIGETSAAVETSDESILWSPASISRRRDRSGVSMRDDCIGWTKDAQPGRHVNSHQTPIA